MKKMMMMMMMMMMKIKATKLDNHDTIYFIYVINLMKFFFLLITNVQDLTSWNLPVGGTFKTRQWELVLQGHFYKHLPVNNGKLKDAKKY